MFKYFPFFALLCIIFSACKKHENNPDDNDNFPIKLSLTAVPRGVEISWTEANLSNFTEYRVRRQVDSLLTSTSDTTWIIDDPKITKVIDTNVPLLSKTFYKVTAISPNFTLKSKTQSFNRGDVSNFSNVVFNTIVPNPGKDILYALNRVSNGGELRALNTINNKMSNPISIGTSNTTSTKLVAPLENSDNVFLINFGKIIQYNAEDLKELSNFDSFDLSGVTDVAGNKDKNLVYLAINSSQKGIDIYDTKLSKYVYSGDLLSSFSINKVIRLNSSKKKLYMFDNNNTSSKQAIIYNLNDDGLVKDYKLVTKNTSGAFSTVNNPPAIAPDGRSIVVNGIVYDEDLNQIGTLPSFNTFTSTTIINSNVFYSPDSKYIGYRTFNNTIRIVNSTDFKEVYLQKIPPNPNSSFLPRFHSFYINNKQLVMISTVVNQSTFLTSEILVFKINYL